MAEKYKALQLDVAMLYCYSEKSAGMELKHIESFIEACACPPVPQAAEALFISQQALRKRTACLRAVHVPRRWSGAAPVLSGEKSGSTVYRPEKRQKG